VSLAWLTPADRQLDEGDRKGEQVVDRHPPTLSLPPSLSPSPTAAAAAAAKARQNKLSRTRLPLLRPLDLASPALARPRRRLLGLSLRRRRRCPRSPARACLAAPRPSASSPESYALARRPCSSTTGGRPHLVRCRRLASELLRPVPHGRRCRLRRRRPRRTRHGRSPRLVPPQALAPGERRRRRSGQVDRQRRPTHRRYQPT